MSISNVPPALSPVSSTTSFQTLPSTAMVNSGNSTTGNSNTVTSTTNSVSTSPHSYSLDRYHEPSSAEKFKRAKNMSLPPISSFDNLIRAAEKQYALGNDSNSNNNGNNAIGNGGAIFRVGTPIGNSINHSLSRTNMLSYQLSTTGQRESRGNNVVTQSSNSSISQRPFVSSSTHVNDSRSTSNRSSSLLVSSPTDSIVSTATTTTTSGSVTVATPSVSEYRLSGPPQVISSSAIANTSNAQSDISLVSIIEKKIDTNNDVTSTRKHRKKVLKPRKKKQCPLCLNYYANLSTHKSTHLTPEDRPHRCPVCERGFARNNDLIRHRKRHWKDELMSEMSPATSNINNESVDSKNNSDSIVTNSKQSQLRSLHQIKGTFKCPYNSTLIKLDMEIYPYKNRHLAFETSNCHQTGVFSRCDTYKNHLKALHFEYPPGTKKKERSIVPGKCKHCGAKFENVDTWLNSHVGKDCGYAYH
ncbi:similar to Saccharomyces cerevisiae YDL048C STP4 Protein containing a Kruppel-type zinc-finger domain [Maudiozyma saulgeensis]|uniref:Similar to Saccharomyces cerevisiae YDL048C STP4 Protein containing a Kruppel-type zinc-finger domain n=1 Tax=Maudiozyma saulgeensis TaxID=1789683 RepID=A0A1X7RAN9_9SACH|nr:similar to Saccharomyces cerevisiae YDL048C STP4 Protein containing a Kruppel-type zinc-finger domain [Kazachstania saulgeensis]